MSRPTYKANENSRLKAAAFWEAFENFTPEDQDFIRRRAAFISSEVTSMGEKSAMELIGVRLIDEIIEAEAPK